MRIKPPDAYSVVNFTSIPFRNNFNAETCTYFCTTIFKMPATEGLPVDAIRTANAETSEDQAYVMIVLTKSGAYSLIADSTQGQADVI